MLLIFVKYVNLVPMATLLHVPLRLTSQLKCTKSDILCCSHVKKSKKLHNDLLLPVRKLLKVFS